MDGGALNRGHTSLGFVERLPCVANAVDEAPETCDAIGLFRPELQNCTQHICERRALFMI